MCADRGTDRHVPSVITVGRDFLPVQAHDFPGAVGHIVESVGVSACDTVAEQVVRIVQILLDIPPETTMQGPSVYAEEVEPGVLSVQVAIPRHHRTQRAERTPITAKARRNEYAVRVLANEGQPVIRLDHLAQPPMLDRGRRHNAVEALLEPLKDVRGVLLLSGLHVFPAEDHIIMIRVGIDPQVIIRIAGIPP